MDLVTWVTACAVGVQAGLFVPLGAPEPCEAVSAAPAPSARIAAVAPLDRWTPHVAAAARQFGVPAAWLRQVMRFESGGAPGATSPAGAMGLMQLMPQTYADLAARYRLGDDPYDPAANVAASAAYLREMIDRFGMPDAFAAYNAGPARLLDHLSRGRRLPVETERYVARLIDTLGTMAVTGEPPLDAVAADARGKSDAPRLNDSAAIPLQANGGGAAAPWRRGGIVTARSGALFAPRGNSGFDGATPAFAPPSFGSVARPMSSESCGRAGRDALFVPLDGGDRRVVADPTLR
jgi:Transglycosylase SLT domain